MRAHSNTAIGNSREFKVITVSINGEPRQFPQTISVAQLIEEMGLTGKRIALERNGEIVPRSTFAAQQIADGDRMEIVVAVGGG
jgi:thiamine biosynthesis protein ThiS